MGVVGLIYLIIISWRHGTTWHVLSFSIFGVSLVLLYLSSALYHLLKVDDHHQLTLRRLDHMMIFVLIAGSYTPFCLGPLRGPWGWTILAIVWAAALKGMIFSFFWTHAPRWLRVSIYLAMGSFAIVALFPLSKVLNHSGMIWLIVSGLVYSLGAVVYASQKPDPFPGVFGFHEIWHFFVLAGSSCHFFSVVNILG